MLKRFGFMIPTALGMLLIATGAFASGGEEHHIPWADYGFRMTNFVIFAFLLYKFFGKQAADFFGGRILGIRKDLEDLEARKAEAAKRLAEVEKSIANIEQEKAAILEQARQQGETMKEAIIAKAQKAAALIAEQAKTSATNEAKAELERMRAEMADLIVAAARTLVEEQLSEKGHEKLVDEYLTKVVLN